MGSREGHRDSGDPREVPDPMGVNKGGRLPGGGAELQELAVFL